MEIQLLKYKFIEDVIRLNNESVILRLKEFLEKELQKAQEKKSISDFSGIWNKIEAEKFKSIISEG